MTDVIKQSLRSFWQQIKKGILHIFTASVINKIVVMLSNMVLTRMLAQNQYGILSYTRNVWSYAALISGFGLAVGAMQFGIENQGTSAENRFYRYCAKAGTLANFLIIAVISIVIFYCELPIRQAKMYIYMYLPLLITDYFIQLLLIILRSQKRFKTYARLVTMHTILVSAGTCIGAIWGINGVIVSKYMVSIVVLPVMGWQMRETLHSVIHAGKLERVQKKELWHYSILNRISSTLNRFLFLIDLSMVASLLGSAETLAVYKVATLIPNAMTFIPQSVVVCVVPDVVAHNQNGSWLKKAFKKIFISMMIFNLFISLCLILCAPWIIQIIAGKRYLAAVKPFRILIVGYCAAGTFRSLSVNFLAALRAVKYNAVCSMVSCMTDVMFNFLLIPKFGMLGAAYATFLAVLTASLLTFGGLMYTLHRIEHD